MLLLTSHIAIPPSEMIVVLSQRWIIDIDQTWQLSRIKGWRVWGNARKQGAAEWQGCRTGGFEFGDCRRVRGDEFVEGP